MDRPRHIAIEGPIGVGKTALAQILSERTGGRLVLEQPDDNPFLPSFYAERHKYAFQAQLFFLLSRYQQQQALLQQDLFSRSTISDYLFAKDQVFAALTLEPAELSLYQQIYGLLGPRVARPDLVIYLQARTDVLLSRIRKRGRDYERGIDPAYLDALAKAYRDFFFHYEDTPLLVVNTSDIDFEVNPEELEALLIVIARHRKGTRHYLPLGTKPG
ncbi:MAG TPA: deoxynucleoside kinase [Anaeromyxobacter sp.]|nr:deoxynucleoside kinase [Anaeromyxobacter sp.]